MVQVQITLIECFEKERKRLEELRFERLCLLYLLPEDLKAVGLKAGSLRPGQLKLAGKEDGKNGEE